MSKFRIKKTIKGDLSEIYSVEKKRKFLGWKEVYFSCRCNDCERWIRLQSQPHTQIVGHYTPGKVIPINLNDDMYVRLIVAARDRGVDESTEAENIVNEFLRTYQPIR